MDHRQNEKRMSETAKRMTNKENKRAITETDHNNAKNDQTHARQQQYAIELSPESEELFIPLHTGVVYYQVCNNRDAVWWNTR